MRVRTVENWTKGRRPMTVGGLVVVVTSIAASIAAHSALAERVRIRWTVGAYHQYGPEHAPTLAVLAAFPVVLTGLYVGFRWAESRLERTDEFDEARFVYEIVALSILVVVLGVQLALILANAYP